MKSFVVILFSLYVFVFLTNSILYPIEAQAVVEAQAVIKAQTAGTEQSSQNPCEARCHAKVFNEARTDVEGNKITMKIPDLTTTGTNPTDNCNQEIAVVTQWIIFDDGRWIEVE